MTSALFLLVPEAEVLLDAVRGLPGVALLEPAHISLGYPWVADPSSRLDEVLQAASQVAAGSVVLSAPQLFEQDVRGRTVVHSLLSSPDIPVALARALGAPLRTPHLSIARVRHHGSVQDVLDRVEPLLPLRIWLDTLELTVRTPEGWQTLVRAPLASP